MESEKKRARLWPYWCAAVLFAVLVVYPLSIGPAVWMFDKLPDRTQGVVRAAYQPLNYVMLGCAPDWVGRAYSRYVVWWKSL